MSSSDGHDPAAKNMFDAGKIYIKKSLIASKLLTVARTLTPATAVILRYHSVQHSPSDYDSSIGASIIHSVVAFRSQMEILKKKFALVSLDQISKFLRNESDLPKNAVAITFDDGFADGYEIVAPILNEMQIPATFYITVRPVDNNEAPWFVRVRHAIWTTQKTAIEMPYGNEVHHLANRTSRLVAMRAVSTQIACLTGTSQDEMVSAIERQLGVQPFSPTKSIMMSWPQIKELHNGGHLIGSHTLDHPNLNQISTVESHRQLSESKRRLEEELHSDIEHFCFPNPNRDPPWTSETAEVVKRTGYSTGVTSKRGAILRADSPFALSRVSAPFDNVTFEWLLNCALLGAKREV